MQKTYLHIEHVEGNHLFDELMKSSAFFFVFIAGVALGFLISLSLTSSFHLTGVNPNQLVGAAAMSLVGTEKDAVTNTTLEEPRTPSLAGVTVTTTEQPAPVPHLPSPQHTPSVNDLRLLVADKQILIDRINQELERVKNSSVALVAEFDQNCGSWSDVCAEAYIKQLDINNTLYADLSAKLTIAQRDLGVATTALQDTLAGN